MGRSSTVGEEAGPVDATDPSARAERAARRRARAVTYLALLVIAGVALTGHEAWPLSSFSLFSHVRSGRSVTMQLVAVDRTGREVPVHLRHAGQAARGASHLMPHLRLRPPAERSAEVCAWLRAAGIDPRTLRAARIYRVTRELRTDGRLGPVIARHETLSIPLDVR